jgi:hypothetical protein
MPFCGIFANKWWNSVGTLQRKCWLSKITDTYQKSTGGSCLKTLGSPTTRTMPKHGEMLVGTQFSKLGFLLLCCTNKPTQNLSGWLKFWWKHIRFPIQDWGRGRIGYCNTNFKPIPKDLIFTLWSTDGAMTSEMHLVPKHFVMWRLITKPKKGGSELI